MLCNVQGFKTVILLKPDQSEHMYADDGYLIGVSPINPIDVDEERFPKALDSHFTIGTVGPGDCLFLPQNWWHYVYSHDERNQAVTMWWKSRPIEIRERYTGRVSNGSFSSVLDAYENYVLDVANATKRLSSDACSDSRVMMHEFEFASDKDENGAIGEDDKGDRDEADWQQKRTQEAIRLGLPPIFGQCQFDLRNEYSPCFLRACQSQVDTPVCIKYELDYCEAFPDYGCMQLIWILNKQFGQDMMQLRRLPNLIQTPVSDWPEGIGRLRFGSMFSNSGFSSEPVPVVYSNGSINTRANVL